MGGKKVGPLRKKKIFAASLTLVEGAACGGVFCELELSLYLGIAPCFRSGDFEGSFFVLSSLLATGSFLSCILSWCNFFLSGDLSVSLALAPIAPFS